MFTRHDGTIEPCIVEGSKEILAGSLGCTTDGDKIRRFIECENSCEVFVVVERCERYGHWQEKCQPRTGNIKNRWNLGSFK